MSFFIVVGTFCATCTAIGNPCSILDLIESVSLVPSTKVQFFSLAVSNSCKKNQTFFCHVTALADHQEGIRHRKGPGSYQCCFNQIIFSIRAVTEFPFQKKNISVSYSFLIAQYMFLLFFRYEIFFRFNITRDFLKKNESINLPYLMVEHFLNRID